MDKYVHERFAEEVINDYFTANVKAEVILDTILTPVIDKILTAACKEKGEIKRESQIKLLAKEFPILKEKRKEGEIRKSYRSCNADYLMCDEESVYLVELKTSMDSDNEEQRKNYIEHCGDKEFSKELGNDFIRLLNHVSKTGMSDDALEKTLEERRGKESGWEADDLEWLFKRIVTYSTTDNVESKKEAWDKQKYYESRAKCYLQREKAVSSKKYLFTAGQMLDKMENKEWWNYKKIKLIYITPNEIGDNKEQLNCDNVAEKQNSADSDIIYLTFKDIIKWKNIIDRKMKEDYPDLESYWKWVADILEKCMNCYALRSKSECECPKHKKGCELECGRQAENREKVKICEESR